jgi:hypothetical protein
VVVAIMLMGVVAARVRTSDQRTIAAPMPRSPVTVELPPRHAAPLPVPPPPVPESSPLSIVQPGDSLWAIAAAHVSDHLGRSATDAEVTPYWVDLVRANAGHLVHPGDADLVYPGQVVDLPAD